MDSFRGLNERRGFKRFQVHGEFCKVNAMFSLFDMMMTDLCSPRLASQETSLLFKDCHAIGFRSFDRCRGIPSSWRSLDREISYHVTSTVIPPARSREPDPFLLSDNHSNSFQVAIRVLVRRTCMSARFAQTANR